MQQQIIDERGKNVVRAFFLLNQSGQPREEKDRACQRGFHQKLVFSIKQPKSLFLLCSVRSFFSCLVSIVLYDQSIKRPCRTLIALFFGILPTKAFIRIAEETAGCFGLSIVPGCRE